MIKVLDCTLRDGGYINNWEFGENNISTIVEALELSEIDFIELGYLDKEGVKDIGSTRVNDISLFNKFCNNKNKKYLCMINYGDYDYDLIPEKSKTNICGIRVCFKKTDSQAALEYCRKIKEKGYLVFVQAMVSMSYSDKEFLDLINSTNDIKPFAFYIVDSFGEMQEKDLARYYYLTENNLDNDIFMGFHSHNNLQLSYSNCKYFINNKSSHNQIIDSSIFGMGRGAGNLNSEIFLEFLNSNYDCHYRINPLINVIDKVINSIYMNYFWGYSIPYYISAKNHCHPNYAMYLDNKKTLTFFDIENIIKSICYDKKVSFDRKYINELYIEYQKRNENDEDYSNLEVIFKNQDVLLIAPGSSIKKEKDKIINFSKKMITVSINFVPDDIDLDYTFVSNIKRSSNIDKRRNNVIYTSNINGENNWKKVSYFSLINGVDYITDNAGLMCINLMIKFGVKKIFLAGFDGYSQIPKMDYVDEKYILQFKNINQNLNNLIKKEITKKIKDGINIDFITDSLYL